MADETTPVEQTPEPGPLPLPEYLGINTRTPADNVRTRSNIVEDGAGTAGDPTVL